MEQNGVVFDRHGGGGYFGTTIVIAQADVDTINIDKSFDTNKISEVRLRQDVCFPAVRRIILPKSVSRFECKNWQLPNLEEFVIPAGSAMTFAGGVLCRDGAYVSNVFAKDVAVIKKHVEEIGAGAFDGTKCDIVFEKKNVRINASSFVGSAWLAGQSDQPVVMAGDAIVAVHGDGPLLEIPRGAKRICLQREESKPLSAYRAIAIYGYAEFLSSVYTVWGDRQRHEYFSSVTELVIRCKIDEKILAVFPLFDALEKITPESDPSCVSVDGVLYSADMSVLRAYPRGREETEFRVPDGVKRIEGNAFCGTKFLNRVILPDCVEYIGERAFSDSSVRKVRFSRGMQFIEGCWENFNDGAFLNSRLESVYIPGSIRLIGTNAFCFLPLQEIALEEGVREIGDFAFYSDGETRIKEIVLPASLEQLGYGCLYGIEEITVQNRNVKGLIGATQPSKKDVRRIVKVKLADTGEYFYIPASASGSEILRMHETWNAGRFDAEAADRAFQKTKEPEERRMIALSMLGSGMAAGGLSYEPYLSRTSGSVVDSFVANRDEKGFAAFIGCGFLSADALRKALDKANEAGMAAVAAGILRRLDEMEGGRHTFRL